MDNDMLDLKTLFEKHANEYLRFERISNPRHVRPDIAAFLLLHDLDPVKPIYFGKYARRMIACADHDHILLDTDIEVLAATATEADIITLIRCGVLYESDNNCLAMHV